MDKGKFKMIHKLDDTISKNGRVRIHVVENGVKTLVWENKNLITDVGRSMLSRYIGTPNPPGWPPIDRAQFGTMGNVPLDILTPLVPSPSQTTLNDPSPVTKMQEVGSPIFTYAVPVVSTEFVFTLQHGEGNGAGTVAYTEAGLFNSSLQMFAVQNFPAVVKTITRIIIFNWTIYF